MGNKNEKKHGELEFVKRANDFEKAKPYGLF